MQTKIQRILVALALVLGLPAPLSAHQHFNAGVVDANSNGEPDPGEALRFVNAPSSSSVYHMTPRNDGLNYGGYYSLDEFPRDGFPDDYFTFTSLSDGQYELESPFHPATGSSIWAQITNVTGPDGGSFGFWEENWSYSHPTPTASFAGGESTGDFAFVLSESPFPTDPDEDPSGHIHNRGFTASTPGDYYVTFTLVDRSTNGPGGGPIHTPSVPYTFHFVAVPEPGTLTLIGLTGIAAVVASVRSRRSRQ